MSTSRTLCLVWSILLLAASGCKKESDTEPSPVVDTPPGVATDEIDIELLAILDGLPDTLIDVEDMMVTDQLSVFDVLSELDPDFLDNFQLGGGGTRGGWTATQMRDVLVARMTLYGRWMANDLHHQYPDEGAGYPALDGLAYGYGSKYPFERRKPADGQCQSEFLHASDCSGMIYRMGHEAGLTFPEDVEQTNVADMKQEVTWTTALQTNYPLVTMSDMGNNMQLQDYRAGDIIVWNGHVAMVIMDGNTGNKYICQSNGGSGLDDCVSNRESERGPSMKPLHSWLTSFGNIHHVWRFHGDGDCDLGTVLDFDGNEYQVTSIGGRCWMAENLRTTSYANGDPIASPNDPIEWADHDNAAFGAWCHFDNDPVFGELFGNLYNWYAVTDPRNVCPSGWHVPTDQEWKDMEIALGMDPMEADFFAVMRGVEQNVGGQLKAMTDWDAPNSGATNSSGFTAYPGSYRDNGGTFNGPLIGKEGYYWSSSEVSPVSAWQRVLFSSDQGVWRIDEDKGNGVSVRCVKDE